MFFVSRHKFHRIGQRARRAPAQRLVACNNLWSRRTSSTGNIFPCSALSLSLSLSLSPPSLKDGTWRAYVFFVSHHTIYGSTCALLVLHSLTGFMKRFDIFFLPNSTIAPIHYSSSTKFFQLQLLTAHGAGPA